MSVLNQLLGELEARRLCADPELYQDPGFVRLTAVELAEIQSRCPAAIGKTDDGSATCLGLAVIDVPESAYPDRVRGLFDHWMARRTPLGDGRGWRFETTPFAPTSMFENVWEERPVTVMKPASVGKTEMMIDWAKQNKVLQDSFDAAERWRWVSTPHLRDALKALDDPKVTHITMRPRGGDL